MLLRDIHSHGARVVANTPGSLQYFSEISGPLRPIATVLARRAAKSVISMPLRSMAAGE
jgi:hypothetical protein